LHRCVIQKDAACRFLCGGHLAEQGLRHHVFASWNRAGAC
jgi:hypothetical protein